MKRLNKHSVAILKSSKASLGLYPSTLFSATSAAILPEDIRMINKKNVCIWNLKKPKLYGSDLINIMNNMYSVKKPAKIPELNMFKSTVIVYL
jgi:hypothetical protein